MDYIKQFSIPFKGMMDGSHEYHYELDSRFFALYPESPIQEALIQVYVLADKQGSLMNLDLRIEGTIQTACDRCLADINLPIHGEYHCILKKAIGESDDSDLFFISPDATEWQMADLLYEFSCLSIPFSKEIDCGSLENPPCNYDVLKHIQKEENVEDNSILEELKRLKLK